jgi:cyclopropane fatty-acyl-phospholipid synthase-like methyltransferase
MTFMSGVARTDAAGHAEGVRRYYDNNAARFERYGQGGASIHRAVWGPGVKTRAQAFHFVDELILGALSGHRDGKARIVDLGCGVGASLLYLASRLDMTGEGITISPLQAARASELIAASKATAPVRCREGNYLDLPADLADTDLAFSIEAFVHSPDAARYFQQAARILRPGGKLVVCDDFLTPSASHASPRAARWIEEFRRGWRVGSLVTVEQARALAAAEGLTLVHDLDLTPHLELRRPRDRWLSLLVALVRPFQPSGDYWHALLGGNALQLALLDGVLNYRFLKFERS